MQIIRLLFLLVAWQPKCHVDSSDECRGFARIDISLVNIGVRMR